MLNWRPWGPLCWVMAFFTASYQQLHRGSRGPPRPGCGFPYHISSISVSNSTGTWTQLRYIIVQRLLDRPLDLWNCMFDRYQAEITVMQFRGHSLPVRQSIRVSWDFFSLSHFVSQFPPTRFPLLTAIGMCHFLPVHHLEWHFGPGRRSKYDNRSPSSVTTPGHRGPGSDCNERILCIFQSSKITEASPLDCLVSYLGLLLGESYPSSKMQSVYSTSTTD